MELIRQITLDSHAKTYLLLALVGILCALGDATIYQWIQTNRFWWWLLSCALWIFAATLFGGVFKQQYFSLSVAVVLSLVVHSSVVLVLDHLYYGTKLTSLQWIGIACFLAGLLCIEAGKAPSISDEHKKVEVKQPVPRV